MSVSTGRRDDKGNIMGWMCKKGRFGRDQKRWFILKEDGLSYYIDASSTIHKGVISLTNCNSITIEECDGEKGGATSVVNKNYSFIIENKDRTWTLFPDADDTYQWVKAFQAMRLIDKRDKIANLITNTGTLKSSVVLDGSLAGIGTPGSKDLREFKKRLLSSSSDSAVKKITGKKSTIVNADDIVIEDLDACETDKGGEEVGEMKEGVTVKPSEGYDEVTGEEMLEGGEAMGGGELVIRVHLIDGCKPLTITNITIDTTVKEIKHLVWKGLTDRQHFTEQTGEMFIPNEKLRRLSNVEFDLPSPRNKSSTVSSRKGSVSSTGSSKRRSSVAVTCSVEGCDTLHHREDGLCPAHYSSRVKEEKESMAKSPKEDKAKAMLGLVDSGDFLATSPKSRKTLGIDVDAPLNHHSSSKAKKFFGFAEDTRKSYGCTCADVLGASKNMYALKCINEDVYLDDDEKSLAHYGLIFKQREELRLIQNSEIPPDKLKILLLANFEKYDHMNKKYTSYAARMQFGAMQWVVEHRYSEFLAFHNKITADFPTIAFPKFPGKHIGKETSEFIEERRTALYDYLVGLFDSAEEVVQSIDVLQFCGMVNTTSNDIAEKGKKWKVVHISKLAEMADVGDVILFKSKNSASSLQRKVTGSEFDHVGVVVRQAFNLQILEATGVGVEVYDLTNRLKAYNLGFSKYICIRKLKWERSEKRLEQLHEFVTAVVGKPYRITAAKIINRKTTQSGTKEDTEKSGFFCSELVVAAWKAAGVVQPDALSSYFWPVMFASGGSIEEYLCEGVSLGEEHLVDFSNVAVSRAKSVSEKPPSRDGSGPLANGNRSNRARDSMRKEERSPSNFRSPSRGSTS